MAVSSDSESRPSSRPAPSRQYDIPDSFRNLDEVNDEPPVENPAHTTIQRHTSREQQFSQDDDDSSPTRRRSSLTSSQRGRLRKPQSSGSKADYTAPDSFVNAPDVLSAGPVQNPDEADVYKHESLEQSRSRDQAYLRAEKQERRASQASASAPKTTGGQANEKGKAKGAEETSRASRFATELYTNSYLIFFSILGTLARIGLQALTYYPGAPVPFSVVWPNLAGSLIMGFLSEDRMLFRHEWGSAAYDKQIREARQRQHDEESGESSDHLSIDLAAARKAHMATKKTIPLYIGLATGFCGSFTSFSSFIRDIFLALSNDLTIPDLGNTHTPRNGGYSFMALLAVILTTVSLSIAGLFVGAHLAIVLEPWTPSLPFVYTRKIIDRVAVFLAWGCWIGAVILCIVPPDRFSNPGAAERWRGGATFAIVFAPLGCLLRFYASLHLNGRIASFPLGTFAVNMFGTAVLGMAWDLAHVPEGGVIGCQLLQGIEDGFCGALTTVSTWVTELTGLRRRHAYTYGSTSVVSGLALLVVIMGSMRWSLGFSSLVCLH